VRSGLKGGPLAWLPLALLVMTITGSLEAWATPTIVWSFDDPVGSALTTDDIDVFTTITNDGTNALTISQFGLGLPGDNFGFQYGLSWGGIDLNNYNALIAGFLGLTLEPGDNLSFLMGTYRPDFGVVPADLYVTEPGVMSINGTIFRTSNVFSRAVADPTPVPEPGTLGLFGIGLLALALRRRQALLIVHGVSS